MKCLYAIAVDGSKIVPMCADDHNSDNIVAMRRTMLAVLLLTSLVSAVDKTCEGQEVVDQARSKSDILEIPAFTMKATVRIELQGKQVEGQYAFLWNGPNQWREETSFPGFYEIRIGGAGTVALKRSHDFVPLRISQLRRTLSYGREDLTLRSDEEIKRVRTRKMNGIAAKCVEITSQINKREICEDASTGALVRDYPFVDKGFSSLGTKIFPHSLSYIEEEKTVAEAEITELKTTGPAPPDAFKVPAGAVSKPDCLNPTAGRLIKRVQPLYPEADRRAYVQGIVGIYTVIGVDGTLHDLRIVTGVSPGLNKAGMDAVQHWQYEPFTCQTTPVEVENVITVNYSMRR